jgi:hypothetical protein
MNESWSVRRHVIFAGKKSKKMKNDEKNGKTKPQKGVNIKIKKQYEINR